MKEKFNQYIYYFIIFCVSLITILVFPLLSSDIGIELGLPDTLMGWAVYVGSALATAIVNIMIFYSFMNQAKINVAENERYKEANQILLDLAIKHPKKDKLPRSPKRWNASQYSKKGITLFIGSCLSCFIFTHAVLTYNLTILLTYSSTVLFAIFFGIFQMKIAEKYRTDEFYKYAHYCLKMAELEDKVYDRDKQEDLQEFRRTSWTEHEASEFVSSSTEQ